MSPAHAMAHAHHSMLADAMVNHDLEALRNVLRILDDFRAHENNQQLLADSVTAAFLTACHKGLVDFMEALIEAQPDTTKLSNMQHPHP